MFGGRNSSACAQVNYCVSEEMHNSDFQFLCVLHYLCINLARIWSIEPKSENYSFEYHCSLHKTCMENDLFNIM